MFKSLQNVSLALEPLLRKVVMLCVRDLEKLCGNGGDELMDVFD